MLPLVFLTALAVGGATMLGALGGYCFRGAADRAGGQTVMAFAAGMMLSAAVAGLILPSLAGGGPWAFPVTAAGILSGAAFLLLLERLAARMQRLSGLEGGASPRTRRVLLFVAAMAIHNFPEGLAAGVAVSTGAVEIVGTLLGYGTVSLSAAALPFLLAFAGGAMLYLICDDMIPACRGSKSLCALLTGFCFMLAMDHYLG